MARITVQLRDGHTEHGGSRAKIIEEPTVTDTKAKTKARLRNKKRRKESDGIIAPTQTSTDVFVSKINWLSRQQRGRQK